MAANVPQGVPICNVRLWEGVGIALTCLGMLQARLQFLIMSVLAAGLATSSQGADFALPAEGPVAFRRDKVPLDTDTLGSLSRQLTDLAYGLTPENAAERRGAAQMLALAMALDPANTRARAMVDDFLKNRRRPGAEPEELEKDRARIWQYISWLETPAAGTDGQSLAACLKDVLALSDPKDPRAQPLLAAGQLGAWSGWIPPLASYEERVEGSGARGEAAPASPALALREATVSTMLWGASTSREGTLKKRLVQATLTMGENAGAPREGPFSLRIGSPDAAAAFAKPVQDVMAVLKAEHGTLPEGVHVAVEGKGLAAAASAGKTQDVSAAIAVLASSAITGREPEAIILGTVDETGAYKLTDGFWDQLRLLEGAKGGRLILPAAAAEYLPAMLAFEKPQFFLKYEVLLAKDFKQLLEFSAKTPSETLAAPVSQFAEIKAKATPQSLGPYLTNSFVRRRLAEIVQVAPFHYSARMLAIQGSGNRPTLIPRLVMVSEIRRALEPLSEIVKSVNASEVTEASLLPTYETCRTALDALERYGEKEERVLLSQAQDLAASVRALDRANRFKGGSYDTTALDNARMEFLRLYAESAAALTAAGGADPNAPPP